MREVPAVLRGNLRGYGGTHAHALAGIACKRPRRIGRLRRGPAFIFRALPHWEGEASPRYGTGFRRRCRAARGPAAGWIRIPAIFICTQPALADSVSEMPVACRCMSRTISTYEHRSAVGETNSQISAIQLILTPEYLGNSDKRVNEWLRCQQRPRCPRYSQGPRHPRHRQARRQLQRNCAPRLPDELPG